MALSDGGSEATQGCSTATLRPLRRSRSACRELNDSACCRLNDECAATSMRARFASAARGWISARSGRSVPQAIDPHMLIAWQD